MSIIYAEQTQIFDLHGNHITRMIAPSTGATEVMAWHTKLDASASSPPHRHDHEELLIVLLGQLRVVVDGEINTLSAGDSCVIPAYSLHQMSNHSTESSESISAMPVGTRFIQPDGNDAPMPPWVI